MMIHKKKDKDNEGEDSPEITNCWEKEITECQTVLDFKMT